MSILMVFEAASLGLSLKIPKCSFFPRHAMKALGTIVDLRSFRFSVASRRVDKLQAAIARLQSAVRYDRCAVPAKLVASVIGLIWSVAPCCQRAASIMVRSMTAVLTAGIRCEMDAADLSLVKILNRFWSGTVQWSADASRQLEFWSKVDFSRVSAPISADVLGLAIEQAFWYPAEFAHDAVSVLCQDASATASGGGIVNRVNGAWLPDAKLFLAEFTLAEAAMSSTLRELLGILWCIQATAHSTKAKLIFLCDNWQSCRAILRGSRVHAIQMVAEEIFFWCLQHGKLCWPIWVPRDHWLIQEADRRSRLFIPHDLRSPLQVIACADRLAVSLWGRGLSFDQAASHRSAVWVRGSRLPFNAMCFQPEAAGVDMFSCRQSWPSNINYVYPPVPIIGRLVTFLPSTQSRAVVVMKEPLPHAWWSYAILPNACGLLAQRRLDGFAIFAFDFTSAALPPYRPSRP